MVYKFFDKKTAGGGINMNANNEKLAEELHKPIIRKIFSTFKDNTWGADLADMQSISKFIKGFRFLLCVIDIFSKDARVVPLKDKKGVTITNAFQKILKEADRRKTNKIWVDKGSEFYNNFFKKWLKDNNTEMYSTRKSIVAERFIRTLKLKSINTRIQYQKICISINKVI